MKSKLKILCVADYFLPGFKAGGPIRTIVNMCETLSDEIEFSIVTRDRDLGDDVPYTGVRPNEWQSVEGTQVYYAAPGTFGVAAVERTLPGHEVLYLNSFFSLHGSIMPNWKFRNHAKILIAPRGEFSVGALSIKRSKKRAYIQFAKLFGLYSRTEWHASTVSEADDIVRMFPEAKDRIHLAVDPVAFKELPPIDDERAEAGNELSIAFLSRISPIKNLDGLLAILSKVNRTVSLTICGPVEDQNYWKRCLEAIDLLPSNISVRYHGVLKPDQVSHFFARHDLFAFPTRGENFGHVIFESLRAGTPVLLSDQTPWKPDHTGAVTVVALDATELWRAQIELAADRPVQERNAIRSATVEYARRYALNGETQTDNVRMFSHIARGLEHAQRGR